MRYSSTSPRRPASSSSPSASASAASYGHPSALHCRCSSLPVAGERGGVGPDRPRQLVAQARARSPARELPRLDPRAPLDGQSERRGGQLVDRVAASLEPCHLGSRRGDGRERLQRAKLCGQCRPRARAARTPRRRRCRARTRPVIVSDAIEGEDRRPGVVQDDRRGVASPRPSARARAPRAHGRSGDSARRSRDRARRSARAPTRRRGRRRHARDDGSRPRPGAARRTRPRNRARPAALARARVRGARGSRCRRPRNAARRRSRCSR